MSRLWEVMTPRDRALLYSPPIAGLLYFAAAYVVGRWHDHAVDRGVRWLDSLRDVARL